MTQMVVMLVVGGAIAYFAVTRMKNMQAAAGGSFEAERARLKAAFAALRGPGESDAAFVGAGTHKLTGNKQFYLALTDQHLFIDEANSGKAMRAFPRAAVSVKVSPKKWTDTGNMQTTTTEGYEVELGMPDMEAYTLRLYASNPYDPGQAASVGEFLRHAASRASA